MRPRYSLLATLLLLSCARAPAPQRHELPKVWAPDTVAAVNGVVISNAEVGLATRSEAPGHAGVVPPAEADVIATLVSDELAAQRAVALGLDADPAFQGELRRMQAQVATFKRRRLAEAFYAAEVAKRVSVSETETRRYFDEHAVEIRTERRVWQILSRDETQIEKDAADLRAGRRFEEVAAGQLPALPHTERKPWDLGYLRWNQVPDAWSEAVQALKPGETSGVIRGGNHRFWIIRLVDEREDPAMTFDLVRQTIRDRLTQEKSTAARAQIDRELRARAQVVLPAPR